MTWQILQGDVFDTLATIEPESIDCAVTSPPYWQLRSYLPKGHELKRYELGSEPTIDEYIANQVSVMRLVRDCLADHGVAFVNIGDTYAHCRSEQLQAPNVGSQPGRDRVETKVKWASGGGSNFYWEIPGVGGQGNLCLIPQRLAIALQADGWLVRSIPIWWKPSPMPASIQGWSWRRCRVKNANKNSKNSSWSMNGKAVSHETHREADWSDCPGCPKCTPNGGFVLRRGSWRPTSSYEPILMLAKTDRYFSDGEPVKTPPKSATVSRDKYTRIIDDPEEQFAVKHDHETECGGANLRDVWHTPLEELSKDELIDLIRSHDTGNQPDVWRIAAESLNEKHYAAFPTRLVMQCLKASVSEKGYCRTCGKPWVRMVHEFDTGERQKMADGWDTGSGAHGSIHRNGREQGESGKPVMASKTIGWRPSCTCADSTPRPGKVLDPFCGSGRTGIAARRLGLDFTGCELNPEYVQMANRRIEAALRESKRTKQRKSESLFE